MKRFQRTAAATAIVCGGLGQEAFETWHGRFEAPPSVSPLHSGPSLLLHPLFVVDCETFAMKVSSCQFKFAFRSPSSGSPRAESGGHSGYPSPSLLSSVHSSLRLARLGDSASERHFPPIQRSSLAAAASERAAPNFSVRRVGLRGSPALSGRSLRPKRPPALQARHGPAGGPWLAASASGTGTEPGLRLSALYC